MVGTKNWYDETQKRGRITTHPATPLAIDEPIPPPDDPKSDALSIEEWMAAREKQCPKNLPVSMSFLNPQGSGQSIDLMSDEELAPLVHNSEITRAVVLDHFGEERLAKLMSMNSTFIAGEKPDIMQIIHEIARS